MLCLQIKFQGTTKSCQVIPTWTLDDLKNTIESLYPLLKNEERYQALLKSNSLVLFDSPYSEGVGSKEIQELQIKANEVIIIKTQQSLEPIFKNTIRRFTSNGFFKTNKGSIENQEQNKVFAYQPKCQRCQVTELQFQDYQERIQLLQEELKKSQEKNLFYEMKVDRLNKLIKRPNQLNFVQTADDFQTTKNLNSNLLQNNQSLLAELAAVKIEQKEKDLDAQMNMFTAQIELKNQEILLIKQNQQENLTTLEQRKKQYDQQEGLFQYEIKLKDTEILSLKKEIEKHSNLLEEANKKILLYKDKLIDQIKNG